MMAVPAETPFDVTTIAVQKYQYLTALDGIDDDAAVIVALLRQLGGLRPARAVNEVLDKAAAERQLNAWWSQREQPSSFLLWMGHGQTSAAGAALACYDTQQPIAANGLVSQVMANHILYDWGRREPSDDAWAVVIVEACGAGIFVNHINQSFNSVGPRRLCLIGVSGPGASYVGRLRQALELAIGRLTTNQEIVPLGGLMDELEEILGDAETRRINLGRIELRYRPPVRATICAPLDIYARLVEFLATTPADERNHFFPKAQAAEQGEFGSYFVGRSAERTAICDWLRSAERGTLVVTGRPGCGKSALLGNLLLRSNPQWRSVLEQAHFNEPDPTSLTPPDNAFDAAVHLALLQTGDVVDRLADVLAIPLPSRDRGWSGADVDALVKGLASRRFTVLVDGLDEAVDPVALASTVLRRLAELPMGRVVVGTRPSTADAVDQPPRSTADLIEALSGPTTTVLDLPRDPDAIGEYVRRRLTGARRDHRLNATDADIERLVALIGSLDTDKDFLFARLVVYEVLARPALLREPEMEELVLGDHRSLFRATVDRLAVEMPTALPLLEALAEARGRGIPRSERMWAIAATALRGGELVRESDIDRLLDRAAPYILVDAENGVGVYRLAHQTYRTIFPLEG